MASALIFIIAFLSVLQCDNRRITALVFSLLILQHELFFQNLGGLSYFLTAALTDILIMGVIANLSTTTKLTMNLLNICFGFIVLNSAAWLMWELRLPYEMVYELFALVLYLCTVVSLLNWDGIENGNYRIDGWASNFRVFNIPRVFSRTKL
jgi:hypothetical protein